MKYKKEYLSKMESAIQLCDSIFNIYEMNKPYKTQELLEIVRQLRSLLKFIKERMTLEYDD